MINTQINKLKLTHPIDQGGIDTVFEMCAVVLLLSDILRKMPPARILEKSSIAAIAAISSSSGMSGDNGCSVKDWFASDVSSLHHSLQGLSVPGAVA